MAMIHLKSMRWILSMLMVVSTQALCSYCQAIQEGVIIVYTNCGNSSVNISSSTCVELDEALSFADSGMVLFLSPGVHTIYNTTILSNLTNISIIGANEVSREKVVITCSQDQGLSFINISGLFLSHITISNCGLSGKVLDDTIDILHNFMEFFIVIPPSTQVAIFIGLCNSVSIMNATVTNTTGIGLVGVNILGKSVISGVYFTHNRHPSTCNLLLNRIGGGAYIFYSDFHLNASNTLSSQAGSTLIVVKSQFDFNSDCSNVAHVEANYQYIVYGLGVAWYPVGGGGGLTVLLAQRDFPVSVHITSSSFDRNSAAFGGGAHVGLFSGIEHSHVSFQDCIFDSNYVKHDRGSSNGGAGLAVFTGLFNPMQSNLVIPTENVSVSIIGSLFVANSATKGGGLFTFSLYSGLMSVVIPTMSDSISTSLVISLLNCTFAHNTARYGAGLSFEQRIDHGSSGNVGIVISNVTVAENTLTGQQSSLANMDSSAMHLENINVTVSGNLDITDNTVTGLYMSSSVLVLSNGANITLIRNSGILGGGIHLAGKIPLIIAMSNSILLFRQNRATLQGGAIYVAPQQVNTADVLSPLSDECFFLPISSIQFSLTNISCYTQRTLRDLNIHVSFQGNEAPLGGAVYGSSLETCIWTYCLRRIRDRVAPDLQILQFLSIYYSDVFDFDQALDKPSIISTVPSAVSVDASQVELMPGQRINVNITIMDDFNNEIPAVISSLISSNLDNSSNITSILGESGYWFTDVDANNATFEITGLENTQVNVTFFTTNTFTAEKKTFMLTSCPLGIVYDSSTSSCICDPRINIEGVICDDLTFDITIPDNIWMGTIAGSDGDPSSDGDLIIRECSAGCKEGSKRFNSYNFDTQCSNSLGRSGVLCGGCALSMSATFGSLSCQQCSNFSLFLIPVFGLAGVLLFVMIALLGFTIDKGWINIVLFYCNILSIYGYIISVRYGISGLFVPAALLSLQIGTLQCLLLRWNDCPWSNRTTASLSFLSLCIDGCVHPSLSEIFVAQQTFLTHGHACHPHYHVLYQHSQHLHRHTWRSNASDT